MGIALAKNIFVTTMIFRNGMIFNMERVSLTKNPSESLLNFIDKKVRARMY